MLSSPSRGQSCFRLSQYLLRMMRRHYTGMMSICRYYHSLALGLCTAVRRQRGAEAFCIRP